MLENSDFSVCGPFSVSDHSIVASASPSGWNTGGSGRITPRFATWEVSVLTPSVRVNVTLYASAPLVFCTSQSRLSVISTTCSGIPARGSVVTDWVVDHCGLFMPTMLFRWVRVRCMPSRGLSAWPATVS